MGVYVPVFMTLRLGLHDPGMLCSCRTHLALFYGALEEKEAAAGIRDSGRADAQEMPLRL